MSEILPLILALGIGGGLGLFYFGGLWLTVRRLPKTRHPVLLTWGSFLWRISTILVCFFLVMGSHADRLIACLITFLWMRNLLLKSLLPHLVRRNSNAY
jgi:F1F0 ATPase subunit 2